MLVGDDVQESGSVPRGRLAVCAVMLFLLLAPPGLRAQWIARDSLISFPQLKSDLNQDQQPDSLGREVAVTGHVNVASGVLHEVYLQTYLQTDSTGISIFSYEIDAPLAVGDSVVARGKIQLYFGQPELLVTDYRVYPKARKALKPVDIFEAFRDPGRHAGMLVEGEGVIQKKGFRFNGKYLLIAPESSPEEQVMVYVSNFHSQYQSFDFETPRVGDRVNVRGVMGQYDPAFPENMTYKVFLRTPADLSYSGWPRYYYEVLLGVLGLLFLIAAVWMVALRKQVQRKTSELEKSVNEKKVLLQEIHHRVKNNLAIISGLLELQMGHSEDENVQEVLKNSQSRIQSMSMIHEKLYNSASVSDVAMQPYLQELADTILRSFGPDEKEITVHVEARDIHLNTEQIVPVALLVNELLVNAFKHAFEGREQGQIWIAMNRQGGNVRLNVRDDGVGLPDDRAMAAGNSLGMLLIHAFSQQLGAEVTTGNDPGACFSFSFPR